MYGHADYKAMTAVYKQQAINSLKELRDRASSCKVEDRLTKDEALRLAISYLRGDYDGLVQDMPKSALISAMVRAMVGPS